jgi:Zn-dependent peptidase ImmA (M78 family)/DNA-binding XRE family transcriptional regulator
MPGFNNERLTEIRAVRGLTMEQLAAKLNITKQMVSKYENGKSIPPIEAISKMSGIFNVPNKYFFKDSIVFGDGTSAFVLRGSENKKLKNKVRIKTRWGYEILQGIKNRSEAVFDCLDKSDLSVPEKAMALRRRWELGSRPVGNMTELLESRGVNIFTVTMPELKADCYSQVINGTPIVVINNNKGTAVRQRFNLAHELGHMVLHGNKLDFDYDARDMTLENEASLFAEYFLMPNGGFEESLISRNIKIEELVKLKRVWGVSVSSMIMHCGHMGFIDSERKTALHKSIGSRGWKKKEPFDDVIANEIPQKIGAQMTNQITDTASFADFYSDVRLPVDKIEELCSLPSGILMRFRNSESEERFSDDNRQIGIEQLSLFDVGGTYYA